MIKHHLTPDELRLIAGINSAGDILLTSEAREIVVALGGFRWWIEQPPAFVTDVNRWYREQNVRKSH